MTKEVWQVFNNLSGLQMRLEAILSLFNLIHEGLEDEGYSIAANKKGTAISGTDAIYFVARYQSYHEALGVIKTDIYTAVEELGAEINAGTDIIKEGRRGSIKVKQDGSTA